MPRPSIRSYSVSDTTTSYRGLTDPVISKNRTTKVMKSASVRNSKQSLREHELHHGQRQRSYLVPMRWEKHSVANQLAVSQLLRIPRPRANEISSAAPGQLSSKQQHRIIQYPAEKLVKEFQLSSFKPHAISPSLTKEVQVQISRLKSNSYGAAGLVASSKGYSQWHHAFEDLMEDLLEDAEDVLLNIPYTEIRKVLAHSREILGNTKEARLTLRILDQSKGLLVTQSSSGAYTVSLQNFSFAIWADPEFDVSRRNSISERPKQILYSLHDAVRELVEAYYYPQMVLHDCQPRKKLLRCLGELEGYLVPA